MVLKSSPRSAVALAVLTFVISTAVLDTRCACGQVINAPTTNEQIRDTSAISVQGATLVADDAYTVYVQHWNGTQWVTLGTASGISGANKSFSITLQPPFPSNKWVAGTARVLLTCTGGSATKEFNIFQ